MPTYWLQLNPRRSRRETAPVKYKKYRQRLRSRPPPHLIPSSRSTFATSAAHHGPEKLAGSEAPEGCIKKIDRPREGKVRVGFFHLYTDPSGRPVRKKKEKTLGPGTMPKHEAQQNLADYIEEYTGKLIHQGEPIENFAELWKAFSSVKVGSWGKKMREDMRSPFRQARASRPRPIRGS